MKRKKNKKEERVLVDLSGRKDIKVIRSKKTQVTDEEMKEFEKRLEDRYKSFNSFNESCLEKNMRINHGISDEEFRESMESMLETYKLLQDMIKLQIEVENEREA